MPTTVRCGVAALLEVEIVSTSRRLASSLGTFWLFMIGIAIVILLAIACTLCCFRTVMSDKQTNETQGKGRAATFSESRRLTMGGGQGSPVSIDGSMASMKRRSTTQSTIPNKPAYRGHPSRDAPQMPLCPLLVVPEGTRLACVVQNNLCRKRQELAFNVRGMQSRGGAALFQLRVSECGGGAPGVHAETLGGKEQLAFLSTEDLWRDVRGPKLVITKPWGEIYGIMQPETTDRYTLSCDDSHFWTFTGDFRAHSIQVTNPAGRVVGSAWPGSKEEYQVFVQAHADAGLLILGLMAIDKCEAEPDANETT